MNIAKKISELLTTSPLSKGLRSPHFPNIYGNCGNFELILNTGFTKHSLDLKRMSYMTKIYGQAIENFDNLQPLSIIQNDVLTLFPNLPSCGGKGEIKTAAKHTIVLGSRTDEQLFKNLHIGSGNTYHDYIVFLRYGANVHLAAKLTTEIDTYIAKMIPDKFKVEGSLNIEFLVEDITAAAEVRTRPDLSADIQMNWFYEMPGIDGEPPVKIYLITDAANNKTPITFDSKFTESPSHLSDPDVISQQLSQFIHSRENLFAESLRNLERFSPKARMDIVTLFTGTFMQHYIMVPANFTVNATTHSIFAEEAKKLAKEAFTPVLEVEGIATTSDEFKAFFDAMDKHIDTHFGSGAFIFKSDMEHPNLP